MRNKNWHSWESPEVTDAEVSKLFDFVNQWRTHVPRGREQEEGFKEAYRESYRFLQMLRAEKLETVDFEREIYEGKSVSHIIYQVFERIAHFGYREELVAASKMLHTIAPNLFVMWDSNICAGYAVQGAYEYAHKFLPRMQKQIKEAIDTYVSDNKCNVHDAIKAICDPQANEFLAKLLKECSLLNFNLSLTKLVDEYNYVKFTLRLDELWDC